MRTAILVSTHLNQDLRDKVCSGLHPRQDFLSLADALGARLITPFKTATKSGGKTSRALNVFRSAWAAFRQQGQYDLIISDMDRVGVTLAMLFKLAGVRKRHILICHGKIAKPYDIRLIQKLKLQEYIDCFVCYGPAIAGKLKEALDLPDSRVVTVRHAADQEFWKPLPITPNNFIVSAGMLRRDYPTLVEAVRGQDTSLVIAAHSPWVTGQKNGIHPEHLPSNVRITRCNYLQLRELYAQARCVAIPLTRSSSQAGSLVMYEAMSMGKALLATRTEGQDELEIIQEGETGYYLAPGDVSGWRDRINYLCAHPQAAAKMGQRARQVVEDGMNLDSYVLDMVSIVRTVASPGQSPKQRREDSVASSTGS